jgi:hypothetical protein
MPGTTPPSGSWDDALVECPWPHCDGGLTVTTQDPITGQWDDAPCPICQGDVLITWPDIDQAYERIDHCTQCHQHQDECRCPVLLPARLRLAEQPSERERREHGHVLHFPTKNAAPGSTPDAA